MKSVDDYTVPAIVTGAGLNALGVVRSLGRARVPVTVVASDTNGPVMYSRYARKIVCRGTGADAVIEVLIRLGRTFVSTGVRPVLFLTEEHIVSAVSNCREKLLPYYRITLPTADVLTTLMHKEGFHAKAEAVGALVPRTFRITDADEVGRLTELRPPLVVKPSFHDLAYAGAFKKAYRCDCVAEAQSLVTKMLGVLSDIVVQEWIDGEDSDIYFCLQFVRYDGEPAASFVGRKLRSWPPKVGGTASCTVASDALHLNQETTRFFREARVVGLASMEYKKDVRSGLFFMVEPTVGRTDYQEEVSTLNGINIPLAAYRAELDFPQHSGADPLRPRIWRDRIADRQSAILTGNKQIEACAAGGRTVDALWRIYDPMPAIALLFRRISARMQRSVARLTIFTKHSKDAAKC